MFRKVRIQEKEGNEGSKRGCGVTQCKTRKTAHSKRTLRNRGTMNNRESLNARSLNSPR